MANLSAGVDFSFGLCFKSISLFEFKIRIFLERDLYPYPLFDCTFCFNFYIWLLHNLDSAVKCLNPFPTRPSIRSRKLTNNYKQHIFSFQLWKPTLAFILDIGFKFTFILVVLASLLLHIDGSTLIIGRKNLPSRLGRS